MIFRSFEGHERDEVTNEMNKWIGDHPGTLIDMEMTVNDHGWLVVMLAWEPKQ